MPSRSVARTGRWSSAAPSCGTPHERRRPSAAPTLGDRSMSRWSTLDRIVSVEPGESGTAMAIRNVPNTLAIFNTHFPRFPVLPGVLMLGSLGALAAELLGADTDERWRLA